MPGDTSGPWLVPSVPIRRCSSGNTTRSAPHLSRWPGASSPRPGSRPRGRRSDRTGLPRPRSSQPRMTQAGRYRPDGYRPRFRCRGRARTGRARRVCRARGVAPGGFAASTGGRIRFPRARFAPPGEFGRPAGESRRVGRVRGLSGSPVRRRPGEFVPPEEITAPEPRGDGGSDGGV